MSVHSPLVNSVTSPHAVSPVNNSIRPDKLTKPAATAAIQHKPAKKQRNRIPPVQRLRVMQRYAAGENQTTIARHEKINRETVGRIVKSDEMEVFAEDMRARFRGLSELAIAALHQQLQAGGKEAIEIAWRVLETNGIIPPRGQVVSQVFQDEPTEDESVQKMLSAFGRIAMERARVFNTPCLELEEAAEQAGVKFDEE